MKVYDIKELRTTSQQGVVDMQELGRLGYQIVVGYTLDGETYVIMQRERCASTPETDAIWDDIKAEHKETAQP